MSHEQYDAVCKEKFNDLEIEVRLKNDAILVKLDSMDKRLFHDNGNESLQSKVNRIHGIVLNQELRWKWVFGIVAVLVTGLIAKGAYALLLLIK